MDTAPIRVLYIAGASRSGSTLLDRIIGAIPGAVSLGEVHHIWRRGFQQSDRCGCGNTFANCPFWDEVRRRAAADGELDADRLLELQRRVVRNRVLPRVLLPALASESFTRACGEYADALVRLYRAVAATSGATVVIDSSKRAAHGMLLAARPDINLSVVHLVRDSRAVAFSSARSKVKTDSHDPLQMMAQLTATESAKAWNQQNILTEVLCYRASSFVRVRYEDLVRQPAETVSKIVRLADTEPIEPGNFESGSVRLPLAHTVSGNPMRLQSGRVALKIDDEWRTAMHPSDRNSVTRRTFILLRRYGYTLRA